MPIRLDLVKLCPVDFHHPICECRCIHIVACWQHANRVGCDCRLQWPMQLRRVLVDCAHSVLHRHVPARTHYRRQRRHQQLRCDLNRFFFVFFCAAMLALGGSSIRNFILKWGDVVGEEHDIVCVPGGQGDPNLALLADPTDTNIVYIGGTAQPVASSNPSLSQLGSAAYSGRLFRGSRATNSWTALTHTGTTSLSSPHADSRHFAWDYATGNLVHTNDGGVYIRTNPKTISGDWFAMNGNLAAGELLSASYHSPTPAIVTGAQDNGAFFSLAKSGAAYTGKVFISGDGGYTGIDTSGSTPKFVYFVTFSYPYIA